MLENDFNYAQVLQKTLNQKKKLNSSYSLRSFARDLGVSPAALSQVLNGKRDFSHKNMSKVINKLGLSDLKKELFVKRKANKQEFKSYQLEEDQYDLLAQWHHLALLTLARLKNASSSPAWIAQKLGINLDQAKSSIELLKRLGFISIEKRKIKRLVDDIRTSLDVPKSAIVNYHQTLLMRAQKALGNIPPEKREISVLNVNIHPDNLARAKKEIIKFRRRLCHLLEDNENGETYTLSIQLLPINIEDKNEFD